MATTSEVRRSMWGNLLAERTAEHRDAYIAVLTAAYLAGEILKVTYVSNVHAAHRIVLKENKSPQG